MKAVVQRVAHAAVTLRETGEVRAIGRGFTVLLGITHADSEADAVYLADRVLGLRIMADDAGKMNLALNSVPESGILVISQFTLYADAAKSRRPSFVSAAPAAIALPLYERFVEILKRSGLQLQTGEFGADMLVNIANDGPVTLLLDSSDRGR